MASNTVELYLYLARRDKSGVRIIARLAGREQLPIRLSGNLLATTGLPPTWYEEINQMIYDSRMLWEPWIQSANSYDEFRANLKTRGYSNIPISSQPEFAPSSVSEVTINNNYLPQIKTMIRKSS
jgi:hypothetical protein